MWWLGAILHESCHGSTFARATVTVLVTVARFWNSSCYIHGPSPGPPGQPALSMFAPSGRYVLDEHKRAEIAGRYSSANLDSRFKCSYASTAREYGVSKSTIRYICNEFSDPYMKTRAIAAAEKYYRSNPCPAQPGASTTPVGSRASIPNLHSKFGFAF